MDELLSQTLAVREFRIVRKEIGKLFRFGIEVINEVKPGQGSRIL